MGIVATTICDKSDSRNVVQRWYCIEHGEAQGKTDHNTAYQNYGRKTGKGVLSMKNCF